MRRLRLSSTIFLLCLLAACSAIPTPETLNQRAAVALSLNTAVRSTATTLLQARKIAVEDAQNILAATDNARAGIDLARRLPPVEAGQRLEAVQSVLRALQTYLTTKGG